MNLLQMKYFKAVCEAGTVSGAAELLHIAQPSLSAAIKELEAEFGTALFKRTHKGMQPTEEGALFLTLCRDLLERAEDAEKRMKALGCDKKSLSLGVPPMTGSLILPRVLQDFARNNRDIHLEIAECGREETMKKLRDGTLDMAFISYGRFSDPEVRLLPLGSLEIVCAEKQAEESRRSSPLSPTDLISTPLVMFKDGFFQASEISRWFAAAGATPQVLMKTDQLSTMVQLIKSGTAKGFLFRRLIENESDVQGAALQPPICVSIGLVWQKSKHISEAMQRFESFAKNAMLF